MKFIFNLFVLGFLFNSAIAQNILKVIIKDKETKVALPGATVIVKGTGKGAIADTKGNVEIPNIPDGEQTIASSMVGYETITQNINFPLQTDNIITIYLEVESKELEEVQVTATRSSRVISDIPTRIETIAAGELAEKADMQSANIKMVLTESTGIQTQQTSAISANTSIRIQGLDGKYTQLLKDGFPLYSGFSGGLSIMQIPPLDLKRAEVIKGSSSTLYGGGAIAGLINLVTKEPTDKNEFTIMTNATSARGFDLNTFYSHKFNKIGVTLFAARNSQVAYDPDKDNFSDIPQSTLYNLNPKIFYYIDSTATLSLAINTSVENRLGGDLNVIDNMTDNFHIFFQRNKSDRYSTQLNFEKIFKNKTVITVKNSIAYFSRDIEMPAYHFGARQTSSFSELNYLVPGEKSEWIAGLNEWTDNFNETQPSFFLKRNYNQTTFGAFIQNNLKVTNKFIIESGLRTDYLRLQSPYYSSKIYAFILPRLSLMYKFTSNLTSRIGGGLGYKAPGIFDEEAEMQGFRNVMPINFTNSKSEKSVGANFDINYKAKVFDELSISINQMFFYTRVNKPLVLNSALLSHDTLYYENANGNISSKGWETNIKFYFGDFSIYFGYTFIDAERNYNNTKSENPLTARHRLYFTPMYEIEKKIRIGYEIFYVSPQTLTTGENVRDYWLMGISAEKFFKHLSLFINFENMLDSRQSRWQPMYTGSMLNPHFAEIWAPTDGFIFNGGFRIVL
jgi:outer membrane receptor for ferrienterochelin and colicins